MSEDNKRFYIKDCALVAISAGTSARSLLELRDKLWEVHPGCIYHHFWGARLKQEFGPPVYQNDFATWAFQTLHDQLLAEKLGIIDPSDFPTLDALREVIVEILESHLEERDVILYLRKEDAFRFIRSKIIVFDSSVSIDTPEQLPQVLPNMTLSSYFYHFIDARRRTVNQDDISLWLQGKGDEHKELAARIQSIDPYFLSLQELKNKLVGIVNEYFLMEAGARYGK